MDWKGIIEKVIITVLAGSLLAVLGWTFTRLMAPDPQIVTAESRWIDLPNPTMDLDQNVLSALEKISELDKTIESAVAVSGIARFLYDNRFLGEVRIGIIDLRNNSALRSKEIEVSTKDAALFSREAQEQVSVLRETLTLKPLPPESAATIYFVARPWFSFGEAPIRAIHDNRNVEIVAKTGPKDGEFVMNYVEAHPLIAYILMAVGFTTFVMLLIAVAGALVGYLSRGSGPSA